MTVQEAWDHISTWQWWELLLFVYANVWLARLGAAAGDGTYSWLRRRWRRWRARRTRQELKIVMREDRARRTGADEMFAGPTGGWPDPPRGT
jgi:hypothetical protein